MDRRFDSDRDAKDRDRAGQGIEASVLPSRLDARSACFKGLRQGRGLVLLTGESGSGKTWLCKHLAGSCPQLGRWLVLDAAPSDSGLDLLRRILRGLGRRDAASVLDPRSELADELIEQAEEGRRWVLVLDEAQNASDTVLEEFRLLSNRLGQPDGVAGLVLVGRTSLVLRLRSRSWESLQARLAVHAQLGPIDAEEARTLLERSLADRSWTRETIETLHARAAGNPGRLLRLADRLAPAVRSEPNAVAARPASGAPTPSIPALDREAPRHWSLAPRITSFDRSPEPVTEPEAESEPDTPCCNPPRLGEARPPLRFEDGVIEVGWADADDAPADSESDSDSDADPLASSTDRSESLRDAHDAIELGLPSASVMVESPPRPIEPSTVVIDDRYAAIQAQSQWVRALEAARTPFPPSTGDGAGQDDSRGTCLREDDGEDPGDDRREQRDWSAVRPSGQVRAESGQEFAPYSRLFSQLNSANESE